MASTNPISPAVAALFAQRSVSPVTAAPVRVVAKTTTADKRASLAALAAPPRRDLRRGSLLNILV
jgi:hypothetical protein